MHHVPWICEQDLVLRDTMTPTEDPETVNRLLGTWMALEGPPMREHLHTGAGWLSWPGLPGHRGEGGSAEPLLGRATHRRGPR